MQFLGRIERAMYSSPFCDRQEISKTLGVAIIHNFTMAVWYINP